ncbi:MAG: 1-deoxy-D-xylulose-5-phosphate synthase [Candidatus Hydrogenedentota bacterium]
MERLIDKINEPSMLKNLNIAALNQLCDEIRERIIEVVSKNGGHLAPSLGVIELTVALHYIFNLPDDKIIWDVGHQCYAHKIISGRNKDFDTLRLIDGMSGFPRRSESVYDAFGTGHSSTSISAALGMACSRDLRGENFKVIAVIGDGAMSGGMAFEAMNQAGSLKKDLIVILNDNEMSISRNVGALSQYFNKLITIPIYRKIRDDMEELIKRLPVIGGRAHPLLKRIEESLKNFFIPGVLFEELGFHYYGPIDGHNLQGLIELLARIKIVKGPIIVHCVTRKGKGYNFAEADPETFHGSGPFIITNGKSFTETNKITYTKVFSHWICEEASNNDKIIAVTAAMTRGCGLEEFRDRFPERFFDVGIAEEHAVTFASGMSCEGLIPIVAIYSTFLQRAFDQILHDVALQNLHVVFAVDRGGIVGEDGATHQGTFDLSYLNCIPEIIISAPSNEIELQNLLHTAVASSKPFAVRYPRDFAPGNSLLKYNEFKTIKIGKWEIKRSGKEVCILSTGCITNECISVSESIDATLVNALFVKPIDEDMIKELVKNHRVFITVEENVLTGGFGSRVEHYIHSIVKNGVKIKLIGLKDKFIEHGNLYEIRKRYGLTQDKILETVKEFMTTNATS